MMPPRPTRFLFLLAGLSLLPLCHPPGAPLARPNRRDFDQRPAAATTPAQEAPPDVPADCLSVYRRALELLRESEAKLSAAERARAEAIVERVLKNGQGRADGYNAFGADALLRAQLPAAAWGALKAATLAWNARHVGNVGVQLLYLNRLEDSAAFLACADRIDPRSPFVAEARAMLAYRQKDCAAATGLIERAVGMLPRDANVRYTAGVISYRCGAPAKARQYLRAASDMAPADETFAQALKVVDPAARAGAGTAAEAVHRQVEECIRFMEETLARAEAVQKFMRQLDQAMGGSSSTASGLEIETLRKHVADRKRQLLELEAAVGREAGRPGSGPDVWNGLLGQCIKDYLRTVEIYYGVHSSLGSGGTTTIVMAGSLNVSPLLLAERMARGGMGYLIQDELSKFDEKFRSIDRARHACIDKCPLVPGDANQACREACKETYCADLLPAWGEFTGKVEDNMRGAAAGLLQAVAGHVNFWLDYAAQARGYAQRTLALMRFTGRVSPVSRVPDNVFWPDEVRKEYQHYINDDVLAFVWGGLLPLPQMLRDDIASARSQVSAVYSPVADCEAKQVGPVSLGEEIDKLIRALKEAGEYEAAFENPDCEIEVGGFSISFKPLGFDGVKAKFSGKYADPRGFEIPFEVSGELGPGRRGFSAEAGAFGGETGSEGPVSKIKLGEQEVKTGESGVLAKVTVSGWVEKRPGGKVDIFVQAETTLGVGVGVEGASVGCEFMSAHAKLNVRAFAEALTR